MQSRVLIVDGSIWPDIYRPTEHWRALAGDVPCEAVHLPSGRPVPPLERFTHVILTGSESSIVRWEPWYAVEADIVERAVAAGVPILGSCFGHQMLARTLSGEHCVRRAPVPELGWIAVHRLADDPIFPESPGPFHVFASHFDEVVEPPPPWVILARSEECGVHMMRYGDLPIWGIQAHPEIGPEDGRALLEGFLSKAPENAHLVRPALAQTARDDRVGAEIFVRFIATAPRRCAEPTD